ncbi:MAG: hypothetical protein KJO24_02665, partial [Gammaproteobacteria bacterium]|nr:hypothetical protein [Gammaproteobacteria bacterium]
MPDFANHSANSAPADAPALACLTAGSTANDAHYASAHDARGAASPQAAGKPAASRWRLPMWLKLSIYFGLPLLAGISALGVVTLDSQRSFQKQQLD